MYSNAIDYIAISYIEDVLSELPIQYIFSIMITYSASNFAHSIVTRDHLNGRYERHYLVSICGVLGLVVGYGLISQPVTMIDRARKVNINKEVWQTRNYKTQLNLSVY